MDKDSKITVHYFDAKGRAEFARYILTYSKKDFTDHRIKKEEWPTVKPQMPLGQVPVVEFNKGGKTVMLCQSAAIIRHLANLFDLAGKTPEQKARADEAFESLREMFELGGKMMMEQDPTAKAKLMEQMKTEMMPRIFAFLEKRAKENGGKNLAGGDGFTYADLCLAMMLQSAKERSEDKAPPEEKAKFEAAFPTIIAIGKAINESPQIKGYLAKRPKTEF